MHFDLIKHLERQIKFSKKNFGPAKGIDGVVDHIKKELKEIEAAPDDLEEWIDIIILGLDGAWRCVATNDSRAKPEDMSRAIVSMLEFKQRKNEKRKWPDWRTAEPGKAIQHIAEDKQWVQDYLSQNEVGTGNSIKIIE